jgi:hypothetical protein
MTSKWNLEQEREAEARRRLVLVGELAEYEQDPRHLSDRAQCTRVPRHVLAMWHRAKNWKERIPGHVFAEELNTYPHECQAHCRRSWSWECPGTTHAA